ncbi:MAG: hypothetical protein ABJ246_03305 [Paracoccaceae bacterium]
MKHALITALVLATLPMTAAYAGKSGAPNQSQPTSSVVTTNSTAAAIQNAYPTVSGITVTSISPSGVASLVIKVGILTIPATAQHTPDGQISVTLSNGTTFTFTPSGS